MWKITKQKKNRKMTTTKTGTVRQWEKKNTQKWGTFLRRCFSICNNYWSLRGAKQAAQFPYTPPVSHLAPPAPIAPTSNSSTAPQPLPLEQLLHIFVAYFAADGEHECAYMAQSSPAPARPRPLPVPPSAEVNHANAFEIITINIIDMQKCHKMSGNIYNTAATTTKTPILVNICIGFFLLSF